MTHQLDNRGTPCSIGLLRVRETLAEMPLGDVLEVRTRDKFAPYEVPAWVERAGLEMLFVKRSGWGPFTVHTFGIKKNVDVAAPSVSVI